jgi:hypothetical protein
MIAEISKIYFTENDTQSTPELPEETKRRREKNNGQVSEYDDQCEGQRG